MAAPRTGSAARRNLTGDAEADRAGRERADDQEQLARKTPAGVLLGPFTWEASETKVVRLPSGVKCRGWWPVSPKGGVFLNEVTHDDTTISISAATAGTSAIWVLQ